MASYGEEGELVGAGEETGGKYLGNPTATVTFPQRNRRWPHQSLKLEIDEESSENMIPGNMWQVYALGGFMVMRWIWARWRERNDGGGQEDPSA